MWQQGRVSFVLDPPNHAIVRAFTVDLLYQYQTPMLTIEIQGVEYCCSREILWLCKKSNQESRSEKLVVHSVTDIESAEESGQTGASKNPLFKLD